MFFRPNKGLRMNSLTFGLPSVIYLK